MMTLELFIGNLLRSVEVAKIFHLEAYEGKNSIHEALDEYYEEATELVDSIYEETSAIIELNDMQFSYTRTDFDNPTSFLIFIDNYIIENKNDLYDDVTNANIHGHLDDLISLIRKTRYRIEKLSEALERSVQEKVAIKKIQKEYENNELTYNGLSIRDWFEERVDKFRTAIEDIIDREYHTVSKTMAGLFFSNIHKDFIVVFKSYRKQHYALARTRMIDIFVPEKVTDAQFFNCVDNKELMEIINDIDSTMIPLFTDCESLIEEE